MDLGSDAASWLLGESAVTKLDAGVFRGFRDIAYRNAGIYLKPGKEALVAARVAKRMRALRLESARAYLDVLGADESGEELLHFLDVISTNFTSFFRERPHFRLLEEKVRDWVRAGRTRIRIWCAAASTGEEPYSIAFTVERVLGGLDVDYRILATDISVAALEVAEQGEYPAARLEPVEDVERRRFFERIPSSDTYRVRPSLREKILFRRLNLAEFPYVLQGGLDIVFCRNVMIYFDQPLRQRVAQEMARLLRPGGMVVTGHAESLSGLDTPLGMIQPSIYER